MDSQAYPVAHFRSMSELACRLGALPAQVLEHHYSYRDFGSWWIVVQRKGATLRVVFDGKDRLLLLERESVSSSPSTWSQVASWATPDGMAEEQMADLVARVRGGVESP